MDNDGFAKFEFGKCDPNRAAISNAGFLKWAAEQGG